MLDYVYIMTEGSMKAGCRECPQRIDKGTHSRCHDMFSARCRLPDTATKDQAPLTFDARGWNKYWAGITCPRGMTVGGVAF